MWAVVVRRGSPSDLMVARSFALAAVAEGHPVQVIVDNDLAGVALAGPWRVSVAWPATEAVVLVSALADRVVLCSSPENDEFVSLVPNELPVATLDLGFPTWLDGLSAGRIRVALVGVPPRAMRLALAGPHPVLPVSGDWMGRVLGVGWLPEATVTTNAERSRVLLLAGDAPVDALVEALECVCGSECIDILRRDGPVDSLGLAAAIADARLVICSPGDFAMGVARAAGVPLLVLSPARSFGPEAWCAADRLAHVLFVAGEAEVAWADLPCAALTRAVRSALHMPVGADGGGALRAVRVLEGLQPASAEAARQ